MSKTKMPGGLHRAFLITQLTNNQGQQGISPVQQAAPITQQVAAASTTPGVAIAANPAIIFISFVFISTSLNKVDDHWFDLYSMGGRHITWSLIEGYVIVSE